MTLDPQVLAQYLAYGSHALPMSELPTLLDALRAERKHLLDNRPKVGPDGRRFLVQLGRVDVAISEIEYTMNPCDETAANLRCETSKLAHDAIMVVEQTAPPSTKIQW